MEPMIKIDKEKLFKLYMKEVDRIADECDWKTHFGPYEIIIMIGNIIEQNQDLVSYDAVCRINIKKGIENEKQ
jgi:hypothetical protein